MEEDYSLNSPQHCSTSYNFWARTCRGTCLCYLRYQHACLPSIGSCGVNAGVSIVEETKPIKICLSGENIDCSRTPQPRQVTLVRVLVCTRQYATCWIYGDGKIVDFSQCDGDARSWQACKPIKRRVSRSLVSTDVNLPYRRAAECASSNAALRLSMLEIQACLLPCSILAFVFT